MRYAPQIGRVSTPALPLKIECAHPSAHIAFRQHYASHAVHTGGWVGASERVIVTSLRLHNSQFCSLCLICLDRQGASSCICQLCPVTARLVRRSKRSQAHVPNPTLAALRIPYIAQILAHPSLPPLTMYLSMNLSLSAGFVCPLTTIREC